MSAARRLRRPAVRRAERRFLVEGPQAVGAAAAAGQLLELFVTAEAAGRQAPLPAGVPVTVVSPRSIAQLADTVTPQGIVGVARTVDVPLSVALDAVPAGSCALVAVLVDARDPGNAGTVIRVADAAGAAAVVLADGPEGGSVEVHNGKCVRASAGSLFHLPVCPAPLGGALEELRRAGFVLLAAAGHAEVDLDRAETAGLLGGRTAWLFGNEAHGLPAEVLAAADAQVRVPIHGRAESLNLATAAAVCLYASARAQRGRTK